jgi:hypothetical protein
LNPRHLGVAQNWSAVDILIVDHNSDGAKLAAYFADYESRARRAGRSFTTAAPRT